MQMDDEMIFDDESQTLTHIRGKPVDPDKLYSCGILFMALTGHLSGSGTLVSWNFEPRVI